VDENGDKKKDAGLGGGGGPIAIQVVSTAPLTQADQALQKYAEQVLVGSSDSIKDFSKTMITLDSALFATYFAILKFLGLGGAGPGISQITLAIAVVPPFLFIVSIGAFVFAVLPRSEKMNLESPKSIEEVRDKILRSKREAMKWALGSFFLALALMTVVSFILL
jgi:hypothetical protein